MKGELGMSLVAARIPEIQLENVEMRYVAETADVLALHQVSLDIAKGEFVSCWVHRDAAKPHC